MPKLILGRYSREGLWLLFLMCALPLHAWTLLLAFRDLTWLTDRTNAWDAVGVLCYGLLFALVESVLLFLVTAVLGIILPKRWESSRRVALLSMFVLVLSAWAMLAQAYFIAQVTVSEAIMSFLVSREHPLWYIYGVLIVLVGVSFLLPAWAVVRARGGLRFIEGLVERLSMLAMLYLLFDAAALVIVVIRNL